MGFIHFYHWIYIPACRIGIPGANIRHARTCLLSRFSSLVHQNQAPRIWRTGQKRADRAVRDKVKAGSLVLIFGSK